MFLYAPFRDRVATAFNAVKLDLLAERSDAAERDGAVSGHSMSYLDGFNLFNHMRSTVFISYPNGSSVAYGWISMSASESSASGPGMVVAAI